jgi:peptidoglycan hydrolase CwlO-like protein
VLAEIVETERQIMLWERKIMLEKEMAAVLDPTVGQDVVGEMKKEIHRMELRLGELMRLQEKLMTDMERSLSKREVIAVKGRATQARAAQTVHADPTMTRGQLDKATTDLQRSVKDTEREVTATEQRLGDLEAQRGELQGRLQQVDASCAEMRGQEEGLRQGIDEAAQRKLQLLLATSRQQKRAKRLEDMETGKHKTVIEDPRSSTARSTRRTTSCSGSWGCCMSCARPRRRSTPRWSACSRTWRSCEAVAWFYHRLLATRVSARDSACAVDAVFLIV